MKEIALAAARHVLTGLGGELSIKKQSTQDKGIQMIPNPDSPRWPMTPSQNTLERQRPNRNQQMKSLNFILVSARATALALVAIAAFIAPRLHAVSITDLDSYVLFATGNGVPLNSPVLSFKGGNAAGRGLVYGGNVGVNKADPNLNNDPAMIAVGLNGKFIMESGYQLVGDSIRLGTEAVVYDVYANKQVGTGWGTPGVVNGSINTFTAPLLNPFPSLFNPFSAGGADIEVAPGTTYNGGTPLAPGAYQDLRVRDGATIYLGEGTYTFRRINTGQSFNIYTVPGTVIQVTGDSDPNSLDLQFNGNGSYVGSALPGIESVALFRYLGSDVQFSDNSTFWGVILAPDAQISLGRDMDHYGRFIGGGFNSDFNDNIYYRDFTSAQGVPDGGTTLMLLSGSLVVIGLIRRKTGSTALPPPVEQV